MKQLMIQKRHVLILMNHFCPLKKAVNQFWVIGQNELVFNPKDKLDTN